MLHVLTGSNSSALASPRLSVFLHFFFLEEIFVGRLESELG